MTRNVFVIGLDDLNAERLKRLRGVEDVEFHQLLTPMQVSETQEFDIPAMLKEAEDRLNAFDGSIDAIVGYIDFPVSTMLPLLCQKFGTRNSSLESMLKCEHKYWSRKVMAEVVPDHVPKFTAFDPFDENALSRIGEADLRFPFFIKPIKSSGSRLGFRIDSPEDFEYATEKLRAGIGQISEPFNFVMEQADLPDDIKAVEGHYCMAEQVIGGRQCTVEGYVHEGEVVPYGTVDSIRYPQVLSFFYYLYPSTLPSRVQDKMHQITRIVMDHIGYDNAGFNIEYYWDEVQNKIWLLEINTRIAQSHCDLFEMVDGVSHQQVTIDLGLGRRPDMPRGEGPQEVAAEFFYRVFFTDATVARVPSRAEIEVAAEQVAGTRISSYVSRDMKLSELPEQDAYSFAVASVWMGAQKPSKLLWNYEQVMKRLDYAFTDIAE
ncbi:MAG: ATP-grasp domain-containing protein [Paracoccus sp. (in: a-proteobacteria)]|jgi:biotin carboxylase|uniref:ATP-grasp domain-containing protein n=1 Tax=unclassified Paracoccus (in: a-proteobacteria) TaxID=2688777 RepID=UPI000C4C6425|nr:MULTISPECIES: ATP-grasp domain-containing protein [unclassified Paracoccus (in: a-proteobacteria)]MAN58015.1 D-alanine--D-alanine ligase [Paracoccus sp. (in: a-proteobacteria)]HIC66544.1 ATP-grasp domain-containing protein [Paracoccus sp. (in: a-proteobacteria)]|tara:strand:- start:1374 stop:2672 length:1299 start_codon:yes stop_codon:yes gene_type:complete